MPFRQSTLRLLLGAGLAAALLSGCKDHETRPAAPGQPTTQPTTDAAYVTEEAFPGRSGTIRQGTFLGAAITYEEIDGQAVFEGDIFLSPEQLGGEPPAAGGRSGQTEGAVRTPLVNRWPDRLVIYTIDPALPNASRVADAIAHWEAHTNVRFKLRAGEANYVKFTPGPGCGSSVGRVGGQQLITLSPAFTVGNVIHEIGHAVGLLHEHTRLDRDYHVIIQWNNIQPGKADLFKKYNQVGYPGADVRSFDFNSRMMFGTRAFSLDPTKSTITKKDGSIYTINTTVLSAGDIATVNDLYPPPFVPVAGKARNIAAGANGDVYIIGMETIKDQVFKGYEVFKWNGVSWEKLPIAAVDIDVDANNQPWIVNAQHEIWRFNGTSWEQVPGWA
ncbi:MAG TPA: M12 family metallopeptidase, partial [Cytophagales bacterium]